MEKPYSILCIDDESNILNMLETLLKKEGYNAFMANNGKEGLEILRKEQIDLILCDQRMPKMNGFEFLKIAREEYPQTMRIMLSGHSDFQSLVKTVNEGEIFRFVSKPWKMDDLKNTIKGALEQKEILCKMQNLMGDIQSMGPFVKNWSVEVNQGQTAIIIKAVSKEEPYNEENISQLLENILKAVGLRGKSDFKKISDNLNKDKDFIMFELFLGKRVKLVLKIWNRA